MKISENPKLDNTYINGLINNIIDNLIINVKNLTVIHEDEFSHQRFKFFLGLRLDEISINSKHDNNQKLLKVLLIKNLSFFLIPMESLNKKVFFEFSNSNTSDSDFYNILENLSENYFNLKKSSNLLPPDDTLLNIEKKTLKEFLIFAPFNLELSLFRDQEQNKYKIDIVIDNFILDIERKQFACLLKLIKTFGKYTEFYNNCYIFRKLNFYKPELKLLELPKNLDEKSTAFIAITQQNKIIRKKYLKDVLRNFCNNVRKVILEKKIGKPLLTSIIKEMQYKKFFQENYESFYLFQEKFIKENPQKNAKMTEIIKYVDTELLRDWLKDIVGDIFTKQKMQESQSGFFGGIKSYFYTSAVDNIKFDETKHVEKDISIEARVIIKVSCFSISEITKVSSNEVKNSSKFLIKNLDCFLNYNDEKSKSLNLNTKEKDKENANSITNKNISDEKDKSQYINLMDSRISLTQEECKNKINTNQQIINFEMFITDFNFNYSTKISETEYLDEIIIPLNKSKETDHIFVMKFSKDTNNIDLQVNLLSQAFRYNHNFIENISKFFVLEEMEQYSDMLKTANLINFDLDNLQKNYLEQDFKNKKAEVFNFSVKINHQILIIPFTKGKTSEMNDAFIFDIGELTINNFKNMPNSRNIMFNTILSLNDSGLCLEENNNLIKTNNYELSITSPMQSKLFYFTKLKNFFLFI